VPKGYNERAMDDGLGIREFARTFDEIGQIIGANKQTVWSIYQRALRKLRKKSPRTLLQLRQMAQQIDRNRRSNHEVLRPR
jgi:DNA-directed RNA polymerase sigma subunit (sigma70/sigma32)